MKKNDISGLKKNYFLKWHVGLIFALAFVVSAFNYTTYLPVYDEAAYAAPEELAIQTIRTIHEKKRTPPPPKINVAKEIEEVEEIEFIEEKEPELVEAEVVVDKPIEAEIPLQTPKPKAAPKIVIEEVEEEEEIDEIFNTYAVDQMPRFNACEDEDLSIDDREICALRAMKKFMSANIKYPAIARENNVQGTVAVQFVVEKDGSITNIEVRHDPGAGLGAEALRVIKLMPNWIPGVQKARNVKVRFNLPVKFQLGN